MVVKLSYVNRKSEGPKLGHIVAKDLRKRVKPSSSSKPDGQRDASLVELNLDGKVLTDEGLAAAARGLEDALDSTNGPSNTRLQVLVLARNGLTVSSLSELSKSIEAAGNDLEELDLSNNMIRIETDDDARSWEIFLKSISFCNALRILNLSNNLFHGSRPFEVFSKVYIHQFNEHDTFWEVLCSNVPSNDEEGLDNKVGALSVRDANVPTFRKSTTGSKHDRGSGLPSVNTINFSDAQLTDGGALFLSYAITKHHWIHSQLNGGAKADTGALSNWGILFSPNASLTVTGSKLLLCATAATRSPFEVSATCNSTSTSPEKTSQDSAGQHSRRVSGHSQHRKSSDGTHAIENGRRASGQVQQPPDELESLRRKIQKALLEIPGPSSVMLWGSALQLLRLSRQILMNAKTLTLPPPITTRHFTTMRVRPQTASRRDNASCAVVETKTKTKKNTHQAVIESKIKKATPQAANTARRRLDSFSTGSDNRNGNTSPIVALTTKDVALPPDRYKNLQRQIGPLPEKAWEVIFSQLAGCDGVLSARQKKSVMNWALDRETLVMETETLGKPRSVQIWRVLDGMGVLSYE